MGIINKRIKMNWNPRNKKYYESLGYAYTKLYDEFEIYTKDLMVGSGVVIECVCDNCGDVYTPTFKQYNNQLQKFGGGYCKKCISNLFAGKKLKENRIKNGKSFYDWCIKNNRQDLLLRWDYELNYCSPKDITYGDRNKYWFKCLIHSEHKSELKSILSITCERNKNSERCKQCNSVAQYILDNFPDRDLYEVWDKEKNIDLDPWNIDRGKHIKIWIFCQEKDYHGSYEVSCNHFTSKDSRCPYCKGRKVHRLDSLGQYIIDNYSEELLWRVWSEKNSISLFEITPNSHKECWWNCPDDKHESFERRCGDSVKCEFRCPECSKERNESMIEEKVRLYLQKISNEVLTEHNCTIRPINPKTKQPLPFDNEIELENGKHLIIEVHGGQHYYMTGENSKYLKKGQTPEEYLYERKLIDRYKRIKCIQAGYEYLEISYTAFDKKETYKKIIDNKIKEILES